MGQVVLPRPGVASEDPSLSGFAMEVLVGLGDVRDLAGLAVVIDPLALARAECDHSQQHGLGERPGILERTRGLRSSADRIDPVHPVLRRPLGPSEVWIGGWVFGTRRASSISDAGYSVGFSP